MDAERIVQGAQQLVDLDPEAAIDRGITPRSTSFAEANNTGLSLTPRECHPKDWESNAASAMREKWKVGLFRGSSPRFSEYSVSARRET